jgi:hypothetical protein
MRSTYNPTFRSPAPPVKAALVGRLRGFAWITGSCPPDRCAGPSIIRSGYDPAGGGTTATISASVEAFAHGGWHTKLLLFILPTRGNWCNEMADLWLGCSVELADVIRTTRSAFVTRSRRRCSAGRFMNVSGSAPFGCVFENVPGRAVPPPPRPKSRIAAGKHHPRESMRYSTVTNTGPDQRPSRSSNRSRPMHRRREIHSRAALQLSARSAQFHPERLRLR